MKDKDAPQEGRLLRLEKFEKRKPGEWPGSKVQDDITNGT